MLFFLNCRIAEIIPQFKVFFFTEKITILELQQNEALLQQRNQISHKVVVLMAIALVIVNVLANLKKNLTQKRFLTECVKKNIEILHIRLLSYLD